MDLSKDMDIYLLCRLYFHFSHILCCWFCLGLLHRFDGGHTNVEWCARVDM
jgi:hypothetical protein